MEEIVMQRIVPHLWFDKEAKDAALFYTSLFDQSYNIGYHSYRRHTVRRCRKRQL